MGMKRKRRDGDGSHVHARENSTFRYMSPPRSLLPLNINTLAVENQEALQRQPVQRPVPNGNVQSQALNTLFSDGIRFLPASALTVEDEKKMGSTQWSSRVLLVDESQTINGNQLANCDKVSYMGISSTA